MYKIYYCRNVVFTLSLCFVTQFLLPMESREIIEIPADKMHKMCIISHPYDPVILTSDVDYQEGVEQQYSEIIKVRREKIDERLGRCHTAAVAYSLGVLDRVPQLLPVSVCTDWYIHLDFLTGFCRPVASGEVQEGDFALYTDQKRAGFIDHTAIVVTPNSIPEKIRVQSKMGTTAELWQHTLELSDASYGQSVFFYRYKDEFINNKGVVLAELQKRIKESKDIQQSILKMRTIFLQLANGKDLTIDGCSLFNQQGSIRDKIWFILKICMGLKVDTVNTQQQRPLMLACKQDNFDVVRLLLMMKANVHLKDKYGKTALDYARYSESENKSTLALLMYGATPTSAIHQNTIVAYESLCQIFLKMSVGKAITSVDFLKNNSAAEQLRYFLTKEWINTPLVNKQFNDMYLLEAAIIGNNIDAVKCLLECGANQNLVSSKFQTSLYELAQALGQQEIIKELDAFKNV